jgi:hydrogenase maturation protease
MNLERVNQIAKAVLYEGYMLYPYRPSSVKNRQRWNFGVVYPPSFADADGNDPSTMQMECLLSGTMASTLEVRLRFLHLRTRSTVSSQVTIERARPTDWQEAIERDVVLRPYGLADLIAGVTYFFTFPNETLSGPDPDASGTSQYVVRRQSSIAGSIDISAKCVRDGVFKLSVTVRNNTHHVNQERERDLALMQSMVSTHLVLGIATGEFVSLLEPPAELQSFVAECRNAGVWPVLVGEQGERDTLLASPIILYDYPQIAPESAGDLFDGTEIDEILSLRIMALTDEEKREVRASDERARQILERTENMPAEQFMKLHGVVRGMRPLKEDAS